MRHFVSCFSEIPKIRKLLFFNWPGKGSLVSEQEDEGNGGATGREDKTPPCTPGVALKGCAKPSLEQQPE